jgi:hypothetical protein
MIVTEQVQNPMDHKMSQMISERLALIVGFARADAERQCKVSR